MTWVVWDIWSMIFLGHVVTSKNKKHVCFSREVALKSMVLVGHEDRPVVFVARLPLNPLAQFDGAHGHCPPTDLRLQWGLHPPGPGGANASDHGLELRGTTRLAGKKRYLGAGRGFFYRLFSCSLKNVAPNRCMINQV